MTGENPGSVADEMRRRASVFVDTSSQHGYELDHSPESLTRVEELIDELFADPRPWRRAKPAKRFANMAPVVGAYLGEVLVRHMDGQWRLHDDYGPGVLIAGATWTFPLAKAEQRFLNGRAGNLAFYLDTLRAIHSG